MIKVSDYIAKKLYEWGCTNVFMVTGGGAMHLNDSFVRAAPFEVLFQHHEQACAIAAEGLFRATQRVGVVNVTTGPGGLNTLTGLMGQWTDSIPAIYVSGQVKHSTTLDFCRQLALRQLGDQEVDIIPIVSPLTKYAVSIKNPIEVGYHLSKAFHLANSGRKGPVWLDVPMDVQAALIDEAQMPTFDAPSDTTNSQSNVDRVIEQLRNSQRPAIVIGHGVRLAGVEDALYRILDRLRIPALVTFGGFDLLPNAHPYYAGRIGTLGTRGGNFTLQNADVLLLLGTRCNIRQISYNWENFAPHATTIAVDIDAAELEKPTFRPTLPVHADLAEFLPRLATALVQDSVSNDYSSWLKWARERTRLYPVLHASQAHAADRMHPYPFLDLFSRLLPDDAVVVAGNGTATVVLWQTATVKSGQRYFWNSGCASMGYDLPAAIGAAKGLNRDVWCVAGDGSLQMNLQELATLKHYKLPVKLLVLNNGGYASIRQTQSSFFGTLYGCGPTSGVDFPDNAQLARAYGIPYVSSNRIEDVEHHQRQVASTVGPVVWDVHLTLDYAFEPKLASRRLPDGRMVSSPLHDMAPFLGREELRDNMLWADFESPT